MSEIEHVGAVLDEFHAAASSADEARYLGLLAPEALFLGTDASERWVGEELRAFVQSRFSRGTGWTYVASARSVEIAADDQTAWFDERLENEHYGECRGTGVLELRHGEWRIEQYNLTIPIPNDLAEEVVRRIRER